MKKKLTSIGVSLLCLLLFAFSINLSALATEEDAAPITPKADPAVVQAIAAHIQSNETKQEDGSVTTVYTNLNETISAARQELGTISDAELLSGVFAYMNLRNMSTFHAEVADEVYIKDILSTTEFTVHTFTNKDVDYVTTSADLGDGRYVVDVRASLSGVNGSYLPKLQYLNMGHTGSIDTTRVAYGAVFQSAYDSETAQTVDIRISSVSSDVPDIPGLRLETADDGTPFTRFQFLKLRSAGEQDGMAYLRYCIQADEAPTLTPDFSTKYEFPSLLILLILFSLACLFWLYWRHRKGAASTAKKRLS